MAVPRAFFLCLALCFSPAFSASYNDPCMALDTVLTSDNPGISTKAEVSGQNRTYTVSVPVNSSVSAVILRAENQNNHTVGSWAGPGQQCNTSVLYRVTSSDNPNFQATWTAPDSEDVTKINLQVFIVIDNRTAVKSSVRLEQITTPAPLTPTPEASGTNQTTTMTTAKSQTTAKTIAKSQTTTMTTAKTTARSGTNQTTTMTTAKSQTTAKTTAKSQTTTMTTAKTTARSLAVNALGSPLTGALHILLVFLISKLLF